MKRLQVGDECYVRSGLDRKIYRCIFGINSSGVPEPRHAKVAGVAMSLIIKNGTGIHRIVYPYPIIKQLAK